MPDEEPPERGLAGFSRGAHEGRDDGHAAVVAALSPRCGGRPCSRSRRSSCCSAARWSSRNAGEHGCRAGRQRGRREPAGCPDGSDQGEPRRLRRHARCAATRCERGRDASPAAAEAPVESRLAARRALTPVPAGGDLVEAPRRRRVVAGEGELSSCPSTAPRRGIARALDARTDGAAEPRPKPHSRQDRHRPRRASLVRAGRSPSTSSALAAGADDVRRSGAQASRVARRDLSGRGREAGSPLLHEARPPTPRPALRSVSDEHRPAGRAAARSPIRSATYGYGHERRASSGSLP